MPSGACMDYSRILTFQEAPKPTGGSIFVWGRVAPPTSALGFEGVEDKLESLNPLSGFGLSASETFEL